MGGNNGNKSDLNHSEMIGKLRQILQCFDDDGETVQVNTFERDELFKSRTEKLKGPSEEKKKGPKKDECCDVEKGERQDETVVNVVYAVSTCPEQGEGKPSDDRKIKEGKSDFDLPMVSEGLLQGPYSKGMDVEFRNGLVMVGCKCIKRDGLQGDCKRKMCSGRATCVTLPYPGCVPSGFGKLKPKEAKVHMGQSSSCEKEEAEVVHKPAVVKAKQPPPVVDYVDNPPMNTRVSCNFHYKGKYYIRPGNRNKETQTQPVVIPQEEHQELATCPQVQDVAI